MILRSLLIVATPYHVTMLPVLRAEFEDVYASPYKAVVIFLECTFTGMEVQVGEDS